MPHRVVRARLAIVQLITAAAIGIALLLALCTLMSLGVANAAPLEAALLRDPGNRLAAVFGLGVLIVTLVVGTTAMLRGTVRDTERMRRRDR